MVAGAAVVARRLVDSVPWLTRIVGPVSGDWEETYDGRASLMGKKGRKVGIAFGG